LLVNVWNRGEDRERTWIRECSGMKRELWDGKREHNGKERKLWKKKHNRRTLWMRESYAREL